MWSKNLFKISHVKHDAIKDTSMTNASRAVFLTDPPLTKWLNHTDEKSKSDSVTETWLVAILISMKSVLWCVFDGNYNMTVWILAGNYIGFTIAAGLIRLHMPGVKKSRV